MGDQPRVNAGPAFPDFERLRSTQLYRPGRRDIDLSYRSGRWAEPIDRLLAAGYSFLPCRFSGEGYLFRGMASGLAAGRDTGRFGHFESDDETSVFERVAGIYLVTHELSDAVTVARRSEHPMDGGIVALRATVFNRHLDACRAAVLAIGDAGMVFRYPFLTRPLARSDVEFVFPNSGGTRKEMERELADALQRSGIRAASPAGSHHCPRRIPG